MIVGFTGTQQGCTLPQREALKAYLTATPVRPHHGDCIGADTAAHGMIRQIGQARIVMHPSNVEEKRAYNKGAYRVCIVKMPLDRNKDIVQEVELLVACPRQSFEEGRSGTWATIRAAFKAGKQVTIIWPDGRVQHNATPDTLPD